VVSTALLLQSLITFISNAEFRGFCRMMDFALEEVNLLLEVTMLLLSHSPCSSSLTPFIEGFGSMFMILCIDLQVK
jgi:hypothetical protein